MAHAGTDTYDGQMSGNILVLGSMGSGRILLVQQLGCNSTFREFLKVHWISKVELSKRREAQITLCFSAEVEFYNPKRRMQIRKNVQGP